MGQEFVKCKPLMKLVGADNPQVRLTWTACLRSGT